MWEIVPTKEQFLLAKEKAEEIGSLNNSIRGGDGNLIGCLAEIVCADKLGWSLSNTYDYDCVCGEFKIDVKTKERGVPPRGNYFASVADYNTTQKCSHYAFCSTIGKGTVFILGIIDKEEFYDKATFFKKGDYDPNSSTTDAFYFTADCYNLEYSKLRQIGSEPILH
jgi:hypothetical protein